MPRKKSFKIALLCVFTVVGSHIAHASTDNVKGEPSFKVISPTQNMITQSPTISILGENAHHTNVFLESGEAKRSTNDVFQGSIILPRYGKHTITITAILPEYKSETITRKVLYLGGKPTSSMTPEVIRKIAYETLPFFSKMTQNKSAQTIITRAELAFFIDKILQIKSKAAATDQRTVLSDVPESHWANNAIRLMISKGIMSSFPDGTFRPFDPVTRVDYIIALVKAYELGLSAATHIPYGDVDQNWRLAYIKVAYRKGFIPKQSKLGPNEGLDAETFYQWASLLDDVKDVLNDTLNFSKGYDLTEEQLKEKLKPANDYIAEWKQRDEEIARRIEEEKSKKTPLSSLSEKILQATGNAQTEIKTFAPSSIALETGDKKADPDLLPTYSDLKGHWFSKTAAKLRHLDLIGDDVLFQPKKSMTEQDISISYLKAFNTIPPLELMTLDPNHLVTKGQAVKIILAESQSDSSSPTQNITIEDTMFKDVKRSDDLFANLQKAISYGLISPNKTFDADRPITKAEWFALVSRTNTMKKKFEKAFLKND
jgi:hypothetical protein